MNISLSLVVLGAIALLVGAAFLWRRAGYRKQAILMLVLAGIAIANVAIWTVPDDRGTAPVTRIGDD